MTSSVPPLPPLEQVHTPDSAQITTSIGKQESGGEEDQYKARNPTSYGEGNPALVKYQNLWTTANEVLQRHNREKLRSQESYLNDPRKQEEVMGLLMDEAIQQASEDTPEDVPNRLEQIIRKAAMVHYGGPGNMDLWNDRRPQYGGPSGYEYTRKVWRDYITGVRGY